MKILYITYEGFDTPNAANQMAETMINTFLGQGHTVYLIQSHRKGVNSDIPKSLEGRKTFFCETIKRKVIDKTRFIKRYLNEFKYAFQAKKKWKKIKDADLIYVQSNPTVLYTMLLLKLFKRKIPIVYSIYDVFPGHAYDIGVIKSKTLYNILRLLQKPCYKIAKEITVLSEDMRKNVIGQGAKAECVHVVPAWYDVKTTKEIDLYKICNQLYETKDLIDKGIIASTKYDYDECCSYVYGFNTRKAIELIQKHIQELNVTIIQITLDKEQIYSVQNLLKNAKEQIKVRNELIKEYQEDERNYRKGLVKKVIHIQSEKDFRNQEISRYKRKLQEYEEATIER